jgi:acetyltransferase-like isoleucine patch superfamily enzyme
LSRKSDMIKKQRRMTIENDVWFGRNVIITNSSNIGNGVIAAAGAVITKDVPDYAVVAGVPARIIKYRYIPNQIEALNKIEWWNWTDDEIRERYSDMYLPVDEFIRKYSRV